MIGLGVVGEIRSLLDRGELSQREIAVRVGVSRGTVSSIARGIRPNDDATCRGRDIDVVPPSGQPRRCPSCGRLVQMPCLACRIRARVHQRR